MSTTDPRVIVGQTGQNVLGLGIGAVATFVAQVLITNALGDQAFGVVTLTTQAAFIAAAATRFGMDVANVRLVAILDGRVRSREHRGSSALGRRSPPPSRCRGGRCVPLGGWLAERFTAVPALAEPAFRAAAVTIPFAALAFVYMGATRGLKIMRYTLYSQWIAQPIGWIVLTILFWCGRRRPAPRRSRSGRRGRSPGDRTAGWARSGRRFPEGGLVVGGSWRNAPARSLRFGALRARRRCSRS